jgi:hypothetical protein
MVEERARKLVDRLAGLAVTGEMVPINFAFSAFTNGMVLVFVGAGNGS